MLKRPCHYFNTTGKCRFGKHCKFVHDIDISLNKTLQKTSQDESVNSEKPASEESYQLTSKFEPDNPNSNDGILNKKEEKFEVSLCKFYAKTRFCRYGNRCKYKHVLPRKDDCRLKDESQSEVDQNDEIKNENQQDKVQNEGKIEVDNKQEKKAEVSKKHCKFYKKGYCRYGIRCTFYHADKQKERIVSKQHQPPADSSKTSENVTANIDQRQEESGWRQISRPPKIINVFTREDVDAKKQAELRDTEIKQLKRRFPPENLEIVSDTEECANFIFTFFPTDPDWPFDVKSFKIQVEIGPDYPFKLFTISVSLDQDLPATVQRYIEVSLREWVEKKEEEMKRKNIVELLFRPFLRWMDRNMETIVTEGLKQLRRELAAKAAGLQFISAKELRKDSNHQASSEPDDSSDVSEKDSRRPVAYRKSDYVPEVYKTPSATSDGSADDDTDDDSNDDEDGIDDSDETAGDDKVHQRPKIDVDTERSGTEISFRNMQIWYCTTIMVEKLRLTVQCDRCKNRTDFVTPPNRVNSVACSKCNNSQLVVFRPVLTHAYSSTFGYLDLDGCTAFDVILQDCHFSLGCVSCSRDILVKSCTAGRVMEVYCRGCHTKMKFAADSVKLTVLTSDGVDKAKFSGKVHTVGVKKNQRVLKDPAIQEGKPLPNNGACKHYKKSFRWLRFPCCGKTYPCDICHDDKEDHEMKFANRMICGFCCKEQPFGAEKPCSSCSSALTKVRTSHWEGGRGCRDKISMSRGDGKKYVNLNKTVSNKSKEKNNGKKNTKLRHT
ncbi:uncharacterized protein LOC132717539 [Ruditapes philippinarum]|uniref:uncharacterized protein LOC132717539 n=1 Tax=Ruditapes philippinarum TaxID=129788 RepID=UPI00295AD0B7|nr:uncharacterized protein LOC132717539 [Ruditapes philippinarum]